MAIGAKPEQKAPSNVGKRQLTKGKTIDGVEKTHIFRK